MPYLSASRVPRLARLVVLLGAVLQVLSVPAAALAEGAVAGRTGLAVAHVEAERSSSCVAVHADDCDLCQVLSAVGEVTAGAAPAPVAARAPQLPTADQARAHAAPGAVGPPSRAPPVFG